MSARRAWALGAALLAASACGGKSDSLGGDDAGAGGAAGGGGAAGSGGASGGGGVAGSGGGGGGAGGSAGAGGGGAGGGGGVGGGGAGGVGGAGAGGGGGGTPDCAALSQDVDRKLALAQVCCPTCDSLQCTGAVPGVCCSQTVEGASTPATSDYLAALAAFKAASCAVACPAIACPVPPSGICETDANGQGRCR